MRPTSECARSSSRAIISGLWRSPTGMGLFMNDKENDVTDSDSVPPGMDPN